MHNKSWKLSHVLFLAAIILITLGIGMMFWREGFQEGATSASILSSEPYSDDVKAKINSIKETNPINLYTALSKHKELEKDLLIVNNALSGAVKKFTDKHGKIKEVDDALKKSKKDNMKFIAEMSILSKKQSALSKDYDVMKGELENLLNQIKTKAGGDAQPKQSKQTTKTSNKKK